MSIVWHRLHSISTPSRPTRSTVCSFLQNWFLYLILILSAHFYAASNARDMDYYDRWSGCIVVCLSLFVTVTRGRLFLLVRQMTPLRCGHYYIIIATCLWTDCRLAGIARIILWFVLSTCIIISNFSDWVWAHSYVTEWSVHLTFIWTFQKCFEFIHMFIATSSSHLIDWT